MLRSIFRSYWFKNEPGYKHYKREIIDKQVNWPTSKMYSDPLSAADCLVGGENKGAPPLVIIANHILKKPDLKLSGHAIAYVMYHAAKNNMHNDKLWSELEFHMLKQLPELNERMIFGCMYGLVKSNYGKPDNFTSLTKEFSMKSLPKLSPYECFELIDAAASNRRTDYDIKAMLQEEILPRLNGLWKHAKFFYIPSYLQKLIKNLLRLEIYDTELWYKITSVFLKQRPKYVKTWEPMYSLLLSMKNNGFTEKTSVEIDDIIEKFEQMWKDDVDFQWLYNLEEKRFYTVHELIEKADKTPNTITWQEGEKMIKHTLPAWYWNPEEIKKEIDVQLLMEEYKGLKKFIQKKK